MPRHPNPTKFRDNLLEDWSAVFINHYFTIRGSEFGPVKLINVTDEALEKIFKDHLSNGLGLICDGSEEYSGKFVHDLLVCRVKKNGGKNGFVGQALSHRDEKSQIPKYFAALVASSIVMSDANEENEDENGWISQLEKHIDDRNLDMLPELWESIVEWLEKNKDYYRQLELPDPRGHTRIGYSKYIAFPSRPDQRKLQEHFDGKFFADREPEPEFVISEIDKIQNRLSRLFCEQFMDFVASHRANPLDPSLQEHNFWTVVGDLCEANYEGSKESIIAIWVREEEFGEDEYLICGTVPESEHHEVSESDFDLPPEFPHVLLDGGRFYKWLDGAEEFSSFVGLRNGGVIPLTRQNGQLMNASRFDVRNSERVIVLSDLVEDFVQLFNLCKKPKQLSDRWVVFENIIIWPLSASELSGTRLVNCDVIKRSLSIPRGLQAVGGYKSRSGLYLGIPGLLPTIKLSDSEVIEIEEQPTNVKIILIYNKEDQLVHLDADLEFDGLVVLRAEDSTGARRIRLAFTRSVEQIFVKEARDPQNYVFESVIGCTDFTNSNLSTIPIDEELIELVNSERLNYLGVNQGEFLSKDGDYLFAANCFADEWRLKIAGGYGEAVDFRSLKPFSKSSDATNNRLWSKIIKAGADISNWTSSSQSAEAAEWCNSKKILQISESRAPNNVVPFRFDDFEKFTDENIRVPRLLKALRVLFSRKRMLSWSDWKKVVYDCFASLDYESFQSITRSWCESGIIEKAFHTQSSSVGFFASKSILRVHKTGFWYLGVLSGLYEPHEHENLCRFASSIGVHSELRRTANRLSPGTFVVASSDFELLNRIAIEAKAQLISLDLNYETSNEETRDNGVYFSNQYKLKKPLRKSSIKSVSLGLFTRERSQNVWKVEWPDGVFWTYSRDLANLVFEFCEFGRQVVEVRGRELRVRSGRIPLSIAKSLFGIGGFSSGLPSGRASIGGLIASGVRAADDVGSLQYQYIAPNDFVAALFGEKLIEVLDRIVKQGERR